MCPSMIFLVEDVDLEDLVVLMCKNIVRKFQEYDNLWLYGMLVK